MIDVDRLSQIVANVEIFRRKALELQGSADAKILYYEDFLTDRVRFLSGRLEDLGVPLTTENRAVMEASVRFQKVHVRPVHDYVANYQALVEALPQYYGKNEGGAD